MLVTLIVIPPVFSVSNDRSEKRWEYQSPVFTASLSVCAHPCHRKNKLPALCRKIRIRTSCKYGKRSRRLPKKGTMVNPTNSNAEGAIWRVSTWRGWAAVIFCSFTVVEALSAFYRVFTGFSPWDDEGYFMISVKQFLDGHPLYTEVFSPYGPFYYLYEWVAFHIIRTAVSHDSFRFLTLFAWLLIPLISAWSVYRIARSIPLSVIAQLA